MMTPAQARELQAALRAKGYDLGRSGPARDGVDGDWGGTSQRASVQAILASPALVIAPPAIKPGPLTDADYRAAAAKLTQAAGRQVTVRQVKTIMAVESNGAWFQDVRADILDADGPGGFLDGPDLPKILFEAHKFSGKTGGRYDASHPNISSRKWNRSLYVGGQGEYLRLWRAMQLNEDAALESASVGLFQVLGENWRDLGYASVQAFWDANKRSEGDQLDAFVRYVIANKLAGALAQGGADAASWVAFVSRYNGSGYAANGYHTKAAREFTRLA